MFKKSKVLLLILIVLNVAVFIAACKDSEGYNTPPEKPFEVISEGYYEGIPVMELKDKDTGVHYLILNDDAITVMYNADGSLKID